ncbi:MAG: Nicotinate-nucleotide adenylyltransferase (EC [uncultured Sulfurovum sp.]|uniref:Multifunctional fusion protein n=1 Tax=uncultured Sulfurovum sp. TaxID=269237 RepID=A0A6S6TZD8_9BACT|nr:MAG: Nicotinate-nucleotide adenylyltransferase (EC [uncultured Sulfurovum sp.]
MLKDNLNTIALFGGSFDPPHLGHKTIVEKTLEVLDIHKLVVVPTFLNPFKQDSHFTTEERFALSKELFSIDERVLVDDYEIRQGKPTPTVETLRYFQKNYNVAYIIIGADNLENIEKWKEFEYLNTQVTWLVATRAGYEIQSNKLRDFKLLTIEVDMSSTEIRNKITKESLYMSINEMSVQDRAERIVTFLDDKKADELEVFNLDEVDYIAKRVVIANAISSKHAAALADQLKKELKPLGEEFLHVDESDEWVVVDLGDILIHLMTSEARQTYSMEEFLVELSAGKFSSPHII